MPWIIEQSKEGGLAEALEIIPFEKQRRICSAPKEEIFERFPQIEFVPSLERALRAFEP